MNLILDTSIIIEIERGNEEIISQLKELRKIYPGHPKISFMAYFEFLYGLRKKSVKNKRKSKEFLELFEIIHTTNATAHYLAQFEEKYGFPLADLFIAAQVVETNGVLVSKDKDFEKIEEIEKVILD